MNDGLSKIVAVDIGSTRTHLAAVDARELSYTGMIEFDNAAFAERFIPSLKKILSRNPRVHRVCITSCVKELTAAAIEFCKEAGRIDDVRLVKARAGLPVAFNYENPHKLGTDRICNALACAALFRGRSCVIIDSGTAITVDYLREGKFFEGGAILPGVTMQLSALHSGTDALPPVKLTDGETPVFPAQSTEGCIKTGVLYGTAGAVEKFIGGYGGAEVVATGGGWKFIEPLIISREITFIPNLPLIGAALAIAGEARR